MSKLRLRLACTLAAALVLAHCEGSVERPEATASAAGCCVVGANGNLPAGVGRLVVRYPGSGSSSTRLEVYAAGDTEQPILGEYGDAAIELPPGTYDVAIGGKRVAGVGVQSAHDTSVKVGVLHVHAAGATRIDFADPQSGETVAGGYGEHAYGFPVGPIGVTVAEQSETVLIEDGKITDLRFGRVVVRYPVEVSNARTDVYRAGNVRSIASGYGNQALELLPGSYDVAISGKRVTDVTVGSGDDAQVGVGVLRVRAPSGTPVEVIDASTGDRIAADYGDTLFGLPVGPFVVRIGDETRTVTITDQQITDL